MGKHPSLLFSFVGRYKFFSPLRFSFLKREQTKDSLSLFYLAQCTLGWLIGVHIDQTIPAIYSSVRQQTVRAVYTCWQSSFFERVYVVVGAVEMLLLPNIL